MANVGSVADLLPRFYRQQQQIADARKVAQILLEGGELPEDMSGSLPLRRSADGHDPARLRGLPAIGRNVTGSTIHTDPVKALLAKERRNGGNR